MYTLLFARSLLGLEELTLQLHTTGKKLLCKERYIGFYDILKANFLNSSIECCFLNFFETYGWS